MVARPLEPEELLARADLAGRARVVGVAGGIARLHFETLAKGRLRLAARGFPWFGSWRVVDVQLRGEARGPDGAPILGDWTDYYPPGERVFTHLVWDIDCGAYRTLWWNAISRA
jgi:hypothetical protein